MSQARVLVAGIGNIFLGDDGFGVEVLARLMQAPPPDDVEMADFGIRGFDLAYALMDGYETAVLVDALPRGGAPGTVYLFEPDVGNLGADAPFDSHGMNPVEVLRMVKDLGGHPPRVLIVGCEPQDFGPENVGRMGLSDTVSAAIDEGVQLVQKLMSELTQEQEVA
ncbi:MAG: hydrogenase maturation protease [Candidatus Dormibacteria bacterium]